MPRTAVRASRNRSGEIDGDHFVPRLVAQTHENIVARHPGIVDENVQSAHRLLGARHQGLDVVLVGEVAGQHVHALAQLRRHLVQHVAARAGERRRRSLRMQRARDRTADAAGRSGHQRALAGQIEHQPLLTLVESTLV